MPGATNTPRLGREISAALLAKLLALAAIYLLFFQTDARPPLDGAALARHLMGESAAHDGGSER
jgi:hypothetical protein